MSPVSLVPFLARTSLVIVPCLLARQHASLAIHSYKLSGNISLAEDEKCTYVEEWIVILCFLSNWITTYTVLPAFRPRKHLACMNEGQVVSGPEDLSRSGQCTVTWCFNWHMWPTEGISGKNWRSIHSWRFICSVHCGCVLSFQNMLCGVQDNNNRSSWIRSKGDVSDLCSAGHILHCVGGTTNS